MVSEKLTMFFYHNIAVLCLEANVIIVISLETISSVTLYHKVTKQVQPSTANVYI